MQPSSPLQMSDTHAPIGDRILALTTVPPPARAHLAGAPLPQDNIPLAIRMLAERLDVQADRLKTLEEWQHSHQQIHTPWSGAFWRHVWACLVRACSRKGTS